MISTIKIDKKFHQRHLLASLLLKILVGLFNVAVELVVVVAEVVVFEIVGIVAEVEEEGDERNGGMNELLAALRNI